MKCYYVKRIDSSEIAPFYCGLSQDGINKWAGIFQLTKFFASYEDARKCRDVLLAGMRTELFETEMKEGIKAIVPKYIAQVNSYYITNISKTEICLGGTTPYSGMLTFATTELPAPWNSSLRVTWEVYGEKEVCPF